MQTPPASLKGIASIGKVNHFIRKQDKSRTQIRKCVTNVSKSGIVT